MATQTTNEAGAARGVTEATRFLEAVFGDESPGYLYIFGLPSKTTHWFPADDHESGAEAGLELRENVYFNVCPQEKKLSGSKRGTRDGVIAMPGFWFDLDIKDEAHQKKDLPASEEEATQFIESLPHAPTIVVHSGHGLQLYWLFHEPWVFADDADRLTAQRASRDFQNHIMRAGEARGWTLDNTADLTRVLRLPGTYNRKREPHVPVRILSPDGPRYAREELADANGRAGDSRRETFRREQSDRPLEEWELVALAAPGDESDRLRWTEEVVAALPNDLRFSERSPWVGMAHAIRASCGHGLEDEAKRIFVEFSERWTEGDSTPGAAEEVWEGLGKTRGSGGYRRLLTRAGDAYSLPEDHPWHPSSDLGSVFGALSDEAAYEATAAQIEHAARQPPKSARFVSEVILAERMIRELPSTKYEALARSVLLNKLERPKRLGRQAEKFLSVIERGQLDAEPGGFGTLAELLDDPELLDPPSCVVPRLAYRGRTTMLAGPDKCGKSTLLAFAAAALSRGGEFLGEPTQGQHGGCVVWVGLEEALGDGVRRFSELGADRAKIQLIRRPDSDLRDRLRKLLAEWPADLVVVDSLIEYARLVGGEAPKAGDDAGWANVMRPLVELSREFEVAVVVLHHARKSDGQYRGSTEIAAAVDALLEISMPKAGEDPNLRRVNGRGRAGMSVEPFAVALGDDGYELSDGGDLALDALIVIELRRNPGLSKNKLTEAVGARDATVKKAVARLIRAGEVENRGSRSWWRLYLVKTAEEDFEAQDLDLDLDDSDGPHDEADNSA